METKLKPRLDNLQFMLLWNKCENVDEFCERAGASNRQTATQRAYRLRKEGWKVKKMYMAHEYYVALGAIGGRNGTTGGFASKKVGKDGLTGRQRAAIKGAIGGKISRVKRDY